MRKIKVLMLLIAFGIATIVNAQSKQDLANTQTTKNGEYKEAFSRIDSAKLPEVIANIENKKAETEQQKAFWESTKGMTGGLVGIMPFIMIILIVASVQYFRYKKKKDLYLLVSKIIESGKEVPIELLKEPKKKRNDLRRGLVFSGLGIAIVIGAFITDKDLFIIGLIPLLLGVAFIVSHLLLKSKDDN